MPLPHAIVVVGSLNADFVVRVPRFLSPGETHFGESFATHPGGKGGNQACAAARLGGAVTMIGQVGADLQGTWLREELARSGVDTSQVGVDSSVSSGVALIATDARGENQIVVVPGANGTFTPERLAAALPCVRRATVVLLQLEVPLATVERAAEEATAGAARVLIDPAPAQPLPDRLLLSATLLTPNETELALLAGATPVRLPSIEQVDGWARVLLDHGARQVLVKLGPRGARLVTRDGARTWPGYVVDAVDTTGAGDAFNGALAVAFAEGVDLDGAVPFACAAGAISVTRAGAQPSMPTRDEVDRFLAMR
jgi:ribokinase